MKKFAISLIMTLLCSSSAYATTDNQHTTDSLLFIAKQLYGDFIDFDKTMVQPVWTSENKVNAFSNNRMVGPVPPIMSEQFDICPFDSVYGVCPYDIYAKLHFDVGTANVTTDWGGFDRISIYTEAYAACLGIFFDTESPDTCFHTFIVPQADPWTPLSSRIFRFNVDSGAYTRYCVLFLPLSLTMGLPNLFIHGRVDGEYESSGTFETEYTVSFSGKVQNTVFHCHLPNDDKYNIFTCNSNADMNMLISYDGNILYNDNYEGTGDVDWGNNSRINIPYNNQNDSVIFSLLLWGDSEEKIIGDSTVYVLQDSVITDLFIAKNLHMSEHNQSILFPNYKEDDAIITDKGGGDYNCFVFAQGFPHESYSFSAFSWNTHLASVQNNVYDWGIYTCYGATEENSVLDMWFKDGEMTHVSVKSGTKHAMGYAWESKLGVNPRVMHPRYALTNDLPNINGYGHVGLHFILKPQDEITEIAYIENVNFSDTDLKTIQKMVDQEPLFKQVEFEKYYSKVCEIVKDYYVSNLSLLNHYSEYKTLLDFCKDNPNILGRVFQKLNDGDELAMQIIADFAIKGNEDVMDWMWSYHPRKEVACAKPEEIFRSDISNATLFVKGLLKKMNKFSDKESLQGFTYSDEKDSFQIKIIDREICLSFLLNERETITISYVNNSLGNNGKFVVENKLFEKGRHNVYFKVSESGLYIISYIVNGNIYTKKVVVK